MPSVAEATVSASRSQHSCFAALAKNSHPRTVFTALRAAASRQCDCHASAAPSLAMTVAKYLFAWVNTVAKRERAVSKHAVAKKNGADRDNRRKKTAGAYFPYVTAVFTRNLIAVASKSAVEFGNRCGRKA